MAFLINGATRFNDLTTPGEMSPDQQWAVDGSACHRVLHFRSQDGLPVGDVERHGFAQALLGYNFVNSETVSNGTYTFDRRWIERKLPDAYPPVVDYFTNPDGRPYLFAQSIGKCEAVTRHTSGIDLRNGPGNGGPMSRDGCKMYVTYRGLPYDLREDSEVKGRPLSPLALGGADGNYLDEGNVPARGRPDEGSVLQQGGWKNTRFIIKTEEDRTVMITVPQGVLLFNEPGDKGTAKDVVQGGFPFFNTKIDVMYEWCLVPIDAIPRLAITNTLNKVNDSVFDGYEVKTLLFSGYRIINRRGPFGDWLCQVIYGFKYRPNYDFADRLAKGWNAWPRVRGKQLRYDDASANGEAGGDRNIPYPFSRRNEFGGGDFDSLFRPDQE